MTMKSLFPLSAVLFATLILSMGASSAQDLFNFSDDPAQPKQDQPQRDSGIDVLDPLLQDDQTPETQRRQDDPAQDDQAPPTRRDPLLDDDDDLIVRPQGQPFSRSPYMGPGDQEEKPGQVVVLNAKFAGWEQAGPGVGGRRLSNELRANWIMVDTNGHFTGQVVPTQGAELEGMIIYLMQQGRPIKEAKVKPTGSFDFSNVAEGSYSLIGWGPKAFFAFGLTILDFNEAYTTNVRNSVRVLAFQNQTTINTDWIRYYSPKAQFRVYGRYVEGEGEDNPQSLYGIEGLKNHLPAAQPATSIDARPVIRTASGGVLGRVHQMNASSGRPVDVRTTRVLLLQEDDVYAATDLDNYGVFYFPHVPVGQYGLLAAGIDGVGLIGIEIVDSDGQNLMNELGELNQANPQRSEPYPFDFTMVSTETVGWLNHNAAELAYRRNLLAPRRPSPDEQNRTCPGCEGSGCQHCQGTGLCTSRCQSFEDWANQCCNQHEKTRLGSGYILSEFSKDLRGMVNRGDRLFESAFYGNNADTTPMHGNGNGYNGQGYGNDYFDQGYNGQGYYYNGQGYNGYGQGSYDQGGNGQGNYGNGTPTPAYPQN